MKPLPLRSRRLVAIVLVTAAAGMLVFAVVWLTQRGGSPSEDREAEPPTGSAAGGDGDHFKATLPADASSPRCDVVALPATSTAGAIWDVAGPCCSAVLLSPTRGLTAGHCLVDCKAPLTFHLNTFATPTPLALKIASGGCHPRREPSRAPDIGHYDLAVFVLAEAAPKTLPFPRVRDRAVRLRRDAKLTMHGHGIACVDQRGIPDRRTQGLGRVIQLGVITTDSLAPAVDADVLAATATGPCLGDSGAPVFDDAGGLLAIEFEMSTRTGACREAWIQRTDHPNVSTWAAIVAADGAPTTIPCRK